MWTINAPSGRPRWPCIEDACENVEVGLILAKLQHYTTGFVTKLSTFVQNAGYEGRRQRPNHVVSFQRPARRTTIVTETERVIILCAVVSQRTVVLVVQVRTRRVTQLF